MDRVENAVIQAARFLLCKQEAGGTWRDYAAMPIGASDGWVSAFVGRFLAQEVVCQLVPKAREAALFAVRQLEQQRGSSTGFGYNAVSGPDADSTAHTLVLQQQLGLAVAEQDLAWLLERWKPNGGCATYERLDAWGVAHPCVTPVAWLALPAAQRGPLAESVRNFMLACRNADGTWPAYWWRGRCYSTFWNVRALRQMGVIVETPSLAEGIDSGFELAYAFGVSALSERPGRRLLKRLLEAQNPDGSWSGAPNLLLTHPACFRPWVQPHGAYYTDQRHLITTAAALDVLSLLLAGA